MCIFSVENGVEFYTLRKIFDGGIVDYLEFEDKIYSLLKNEKIKLTTGEIVTDK